MIRILLICGLINICASAELYEGDACSKDGTLGTCVSVDQCPRAIDDIKKKQYPQICSFKGIMPIVCCVNHTNSLPIAPWTTTTQAPLPSDDGCGPLTPSLTVAKTGRKAWDKCIEYQQKLLFPCKISLIPSPEAVRQNHCPHNTQELIIRGTETWTHEFPHMTRVGISNVGKVEWIKICAGALISDRFVLTTAHCTRIRGSDSSDQKVSHVLLDNNTTHSVARVISHPLYRPPKRGNDIALLELEKSLVLDHFTVPACLPVADLGLRQTIATGWDLSFYTRERSETLQRTIVHRVPSSVCTSSLSPRQAAALEHHSCFQDRSNNTCLGSGDILQVEHQQAYCMYTVVGLGSVAPRSCLASLAVYTDVAPYVPWIEDIVWK